MLKIFFLVLLFAVLLKLYLTKASFVIYIKKLLLPLAISLFILSLIFLSDAAVTSAKKGIDLWFNIVLPSLFPFFVASELLNMTGFTKAVGVLLEPIMRPVFNLPGCSSFAFAMGITSGYPVGAKVTASLREENLLSKNEAQRLLAFSNNSGPLFIIGAVAVGMLDRPDLGVFLLACHIFASITVGVLFGLFGRTKPSKPLKQRGNLIKRFKMELLSIRRDSSSNFGIMLGEAVKRSIMTILSIGGFIILFSVIISLLFTSGLVDLVSGHIAYCLSPFGINKEVIASVISGFFEITTGTSTASRIFSISQQAKLSLISMIVGWAGLSVHFQVLSIVSRTDIGIRPYILGKFLQGILSSLYTLAGIKIAGLLSLNNKPAFNGFYSISYAGWREYFIYGWISLFAALFLIILCIGLTIFIKNTKK